MVKLQAGLAVSSLYMDPILNIPAERPRKRTRMLPVLLGLAVLLCVLSLIPLRGDSEPAPVTQQAN